ncbi:hypothetical protein GCM10010104_35270 [Streptomyces indiaensis]|uniref:ABC transporter domain-containing protein n=1 Tax=Streptomyces indiaensis TaxID=284033 RepID=A0ABN3DNI0_9ACTN
MRPGEVVGVIGPNGAGKSTLGKAVFGLLRVRSGTVRLHGEDVSGLPAHELVRRGVVYVPQLQNVFPTLTVEENLRMGVYLRPKEHTRRVAAVEELFPLLADRRKQKAGAMSGGERQMLAMARALMTVFDPEHCTTLAPVTRSMNASGMPEAAAPAIASTPAARTRSADWAATASWPASSPETTVGTDLPRTPPASLIFSIANFRDSICVGPR